MYKYYLFCDATAEAVVDAHRFKNEADAISYAWKRWNTLTDEEKRQRRFFYVLEQYLTDEGDRISGPYLLYLHL